jgi:hypothetical protein
MDEGLLKGTCYSLCRTEAEIDEIETIVARAETDYSSGLIDFSKTKPFLYRGKKRMVLVFQRFSSENLWINNIANAIRSKFRLQFLDRKTLIFRLSSIFDQLFSLDDFTLIRFDFHHFFPTLSTSYVYKKLIKNVTLGKENDDLIKKYCSQIGRCWPGTSISNVFCELIGQTFDMGIRAEFAQNGVLFYGRFVDDGVLIVRKYVTKEDAVKRFRSVVNSVFHDPSFDKGKSKNGTCIYTKKSGKFAYCSLRSLCPSPSSFSFPFLGYVFKLNYRADDDCSVNIGISLEKQEKIINRLVALIKKYAINKEALLVALKLNCSRIVYRKRNFREKAQWRASGIPTLYSQIALEPENLDDLTRQFLKDAVSNAFAKSGVSPIPDIRGAIKAQKVFSLEDGFLNNKTIILDSRIGVSYDDLFSMVITVDPFSHKATYGELVKKLLLDVGLSY